MLFSLTTCTHIRTKTVFYQVKQKSQFFSSFHCYVSYGEVFFFQIAQNFHSKITFNCLLSKKLSKPFYNQVITVDKPKVKEVEVEKTAQTLTTVYLAKDHFAFLQST